jgi:hypothetical protein
MIRGLRPLLFIAVACTAPAAAAQVVDPEKPLLPRITPDCRKPDPNEIVVCGSRDERSPYRLPPPPPPVFDWRGSAPSVSRERNGLFDVGETGIGSCSNVGPGGPFGCTFKQWKHQEQQRRSKKY